MAKQTMGEIISALRRNRGMTQRELAEIMGVTDKAVSKWERNLSCPDISSVPKLAEVLDTSVETLMDVSPKEETGDKESVEKIVDMILKALPLAMGVALAVLSILGKMGELGGYFLMTGLGIFCLAVRQFKE